MDEEKDFLKDWGWVEGEDDIWHKKGYAAYYRLAFWRELVSREAAQHRVYLTAFGVGGLAGIAISIIFWLVFVR